MNLQVYKVKNTKLYRYTIFVMTTLAVITANQANAQQAKRYPLKFNDLATRWDDAMPLGNGTLGSLVWQRQGRLRMSLDRVDLWDDRPMLSLQKFDFAFVQKKFKENQYREVQRLGDAPYDEEAAPTKIRGASLEFNISALGKVQSNVLDIATGINTIRFDKGATFTTYVQATAPEGVFEFSNAEPSLLPELIIPEYVEEETLAKDDNAHATQALSRLGYKKGTICKTANSIHYRQPTHNGNYYEVLITWQRLPGKILRGYWTISNNTAAKIDAGISGSTHKLKAAHLAWWKQYWQRSLVSIPDTIIERQYYMDMYKFACVARANTPPISLQAVWTADNGMLPPWKGDYHHDLNTQLSYWPGYMSNHLDLTEGFTNWLWRVKEENKRWTKRYFATDGVNVPGVSTISGKPMGGWIQYAMGPTVSTWLSQHFYWQWKYSGDNKFLRERCKPYFDEVARYLRGIRVTNEKTGKYMLPLSSSPEYNNNGKEAWFTEYTNFDLALIRSFFEKYDEVAQAATGHRDYRIRAELSHFPELNYDSTGLTIAPGHPIEHSHRHHSHMLAIYPLKLLNPDRSADKQVIDLSLKRMAEKGTRSWVGYSFAWAASLYAQNGMADSAATMLHRFATNFVSANTFHVNGDQRAGQFSDFTYRPFTLEGNFAFCQGLHEMLLRSSRGYLEIFPATPANWAEASFKDLLAEGGLRVSAERRNGKLYTVQIHSSKQQMVQIKWPEGVSFTMNKSQRKYSRTKDRISFLIKAGETLRISEKV